VNFSLAQDEGDETTETNLVEYIVTSETANLRSLPNTSSEIVGRVTQGESIFIYQESAEVDGWLRVYREDEEDAYIADYLVERAPTRFYNPAQPPVVTVEGRGGQISEEIELPQGIYRLDATIQGNAFIFTPIVLDGNCDESSIFNVLNFDVNTLTASEMIFSTGCTFIFESDNVRGEWIVEFRDVTDPEFLEESVLEVENNTTFNGFGQQVSMPTLLAAGVWTINANVQDRAFILSPLVVVGDCSTRTVFNELDFEAESLEVSTVYRADENCVIFWKTSNVDSEWTLTFEKLR
jgi:hypothetical protein